LRTTDAKGKQPIHWAVRKNARAAVEALLIAGADVNVPDGYGATPLQMAQQFNYTAMVGYLKSRGAKETP
jgi:ankyrin repeat protein